MHTITHRQMSPDTYPKYAYLRLDSRMYSLQDQYDEYGKILECLDGHFMVKMGFRQPWGNLCLEMFILKVHFFQAMP